MLERKNKLIRSLPVSIDGAVLFSEPNLLYYTGFGCDNGCALITRERAVFYTDSRYIEAAKSQVQGFLVEPMHKLGVQISEFCGAYGAQRIAVESEYLTIAQLRALRKSARGISFDCSDRLTRAIRTQRAVKEPIELEWMLHAQRITEKALEATVRYIKPGICELEIARILLNECLIRGAEGPSFPFIVASGENGSKPHAVPSQRCLQSGDLITIDMGIKWKGYCSDMTRTFALGQIDAQRANAYETVLRAQKTALAKLRAGASPYGVDRAARDVIEKAGYPGAFCHSLGHSLGLEIHEPPSLSPRKGAKALAEGMVTSVEPGIYLEGQFGIRIEDVVAIEKNGINNLTAFPKELICLPV